MLRTGALLCKDGPPSNCIHAHAVMAQRPEFLFVVEVRPGACEVALECACGRTTITCALAESDRGLVGPLEALNQYTPAHPGRWRSGPLKIVYLGVCVVILRGQHVVFAR